MLPAVFEVVEEIAKELLLTALFPGRTTRILITSGSLFDVFSKR
jgi:hypothetical protein